MENENNKLDAKIEAVLFYKAEPMSIKKLADLLHSKEDEISAALTVLEARLGGGGLTLVRKENEVTLATSKESSALIEAITKDELSKELGKAALDTLAIILYYGPITRAGIDDIRGVNSSFILRNLAIRGLVEKTVNPLDARTFLYKGTFELLSYLGISKIEELPDWQELRNEIENKVKNMPGSEEAAQVGEQTLVNTNN